MTVVDHDPQVAPNEPPLPEILARLKADLTGLVQSEVALAKVEVRETAIQAAKGAGMMGGSAYIGSTAFLLLSFAGAFALAAIMPTALAFLVMAVIYLIGAAVLFRSGKQQFTTLKGPEQTVATMKENVQWAKQQLS